MKNKAIYYPRIPSINFYDNEGVVCGGITGSMAKDKFARMVKEGRLPLLSLRKHVRTTIG